MGIAGIRILSSMRLGEFIKALRQSRQSGETSRHFNLKFVSIDTFD